MQQQLLGRKVMVETGHYAVLKLDDTPSYGVYRLFRTTSGRIVGYSCIQRLVGKQALETATKLMVDCENNFAGQAE